MLVNGFVVLPNGLRTTKFLAYILVNLSTDEVEGNQLGLLSIVSEGIGVMMEERGLSKERAKERQGVDRHWFHLCDKNWESFCKRFLP